MNDLPNNLYSNIRLLAPDGQVLSKIPAKRAKWYLGKGLATTIDDHTLQLNFEPSGRRQLADWYLIEHTNRCVVCGETDEKFLEKHHIVPACFRTHLPERFKNKRCFDLTLLCGDCHDDYEVYAQDFKEQLMDEAGVEPYEFTEECKRKRAAIKAMKSLFSDSGRMNDIGKERCLERVRAELGNKEFDVSDMDRLIREISKSQMEVFEKITNHHKPYEKFIISWRKHFLAHANPKFMDPSWLKDIEVVE